MNEKKMLYQSVIDDFTKAIRSNTGLEYTEIRHVELSFIENGVAVDGIAVYWKKDIRVVMFSPFKGKETSRHIQFSFPYTFFDDRAGSDLGVVRGKELLLELYKENA